MNRQWKAVLVCVLSAPSLLTPGLVRGDSPAGGLAVAEDAILAPCVSCSSCASCEVPAKPKPSPCLGSHKGLFYDNDFSYLTEPGYSGSCLGDELKRLELGPCGKFGTLDVGGQLRLRYHHERGMAQQANATRFQDTENDFLLTRLRLYTNWEVNDRVRLFAEGIFAETTRSKDYVYRPIDRNYGDLNNLFVDIDLDDHNTVRIGRQELLYGNQRLISPLDWANTRRKFEGVKWMFHAGDWKVDTFFTNFVPVDANAFDEADYHQKFYGTYASYSGLKDHTLEAYYIGYDNENQAGPPASSDFSLHTFGGRLLGSRGSWLYELEGGGQFGRESGLALDHSASFGTAGLGRRFDLPWSPTAWLYYDYASGNTPTGDFDRFNDLFPLAHKYLGFIDAVLRRNVESPNLLVTLKPDDKTQLLFWYYHFLSNQKGDAIPSVGGTPAQSTASRDFGDELDIIVQRRLTPRASILFGWSHLWRGSKIQAPEDADFFYTQFELNF